MESTRIESEAKASVDLSELLTFNVGFKNLEVVLRTILSRLDNVESDVAGNMATCAARDQGLDNAVEELRGALQEQRDIQAGLAQRCDDLEDQVSAAQEVAKNAGSRADDAHRRLDALGTVPSPAGADAIAAASSPDYADDIAQLKRAVSSLEKTKADKKVEDDLAALEERLNAALGEIKGLQEATAQRCAQLEGKVADVDAASQRRDDDLARRIGGGNASAATPVAAAGNASGGDWNTPFNALKDAVANLSNDNEAMKAKLAALAGIGSAAGGGGGDVSQAQFVLLQASVAELERRPLAKDYDQAIELLIQQAKVLGNECSNVAAEAKALEAKKANKSDLAALGERITAAASAANQAAAAAGSISPRSDVDSKGLNDCTRRIDELQRALGNLDGKVRSLEQQKTDKDITQNIVEELNAIKQQLLGMAVAKAHNDDDASTRASDQGLIDAMQQQLGGLLEENSKHVDWTKGQVLEIRAIIEHIHHTKADTALVANKAERDFVENSMEKLMREVEQVLNATNAGLIDTLDKSLNILRDMIDGKATKQDVVKLQSLIGEDQGGNVPEGLTGFKGYRCLGCNRAMEGMRQRPMGGNFSTFMNRLPNGQRPPSSVQPPSSAQGSRIAGPSPPAGYIGNVPQSH